MNATGHVRHQIARVARAQIPACPRQVEWQLLYGSRIPEHIRDKPSPSQARAASLPTSSASCPGINDAKRAVDGFRADLPKMSKKIAESLDPDAVDSLVLGNVSLHARQLRQLPRSRDSRTMLEVAAGTERKTAACNLPASIPAATSSATSMAACKAATVPPPRSSRSWRCKKSDCRARWTGCEGVTGADGSTRRIASSRPCDLVRFCFPVALSAVLD